MLLRSLFLSCAATFAFVATPLAFAQSEDATLRAPEATYVMTEAPDDHVVGSEDAAILMHVYASVTCPHCGDWFSKDYPRVKAELIDTGKVRFIFRALPTEPAQLAMAGFLLAECAPSEDYMDVITYQMENQEAIFAAAKLGQAKTAYDKIAKLAGMETDEAVAACFANPDMLEHIALNQSRATAAKVSGVPAVYVNGQPYPGEATAESLIKVLTQMDADGLTALPDDLPVAAPHDHSGEDHSNH